MDISARLGLFIPPEYNCANDDCMGHKMLLIHDYRSFLKDTVDSQLTSVADRENVQGQIVYNDPEYVGSSAVCTEASALGDSLYSCLAIINPDSKSSSDFKEYSGLWQDYEEAGDNVVIGPITVYRYSTYDGLNNHRSYSSYSAKRDPCPDIDPSNRFPLLIASGYYHHLLPAGQLPTSWFIRWDAPSENDSAVLDFYIQGSYVMNVFVGPSEDETTMRHISSVDSTPGLFDKAGSNGRNPQSRNLTLTVRGGENNRYYLLRQLPTIQVTIKMEMNLSMFFSDTFIANIATLLSIPITRIKIASVRKGSVIVDFQVYPNVTVAQTHSDVVAQVVELQQVANNFTKVVNNGALEKQLNVTISRLSLQPPTIPSTNSTANTNTTTSSVSSSFDSSPILLIGTQFPTAAPTTKPSPNPTNIPTKKPSPSPSTVPTRSPTVHPTFFNQTATPSTTPTLSPTVSPTVTPTVSPTLSPTQSPTNSPTKSPTSKPTKQPTVVPTDFPTFLPSEDPTDTPSATPTSESTDYPSIAPSVIPTLDPTLGPTYVNDTNYPTPNPSNQPSLQPSVINATFHPIWSLPTNSPTSKPHTKSPTIKPSIKPTTEPTFQPTDVPTDIPSDITTSSPSVDLLSQPSDIPSESPTLSPTVEFGANVPINPTNCPSISPTFLPTSANTLSTKNVKSKSSSTVIIATSVVAAVVFTIGAVYYYVRSTSINKVSGSFIFGKNRKYLLEDENAF